ncbi:hypothetical protein BDF21DRAFT_400075 [Thamnidium elegans]|nr:hypothetical protein BDF21DRAFT_400075 [Thamnidium elegans]
MMYICCDEIEVNLKMKELIENIRIPTVNSVIGFDVERVVIVDNFLVDAMQIMFQNIAYVLHTARTWSSLPAYLKELLADDNIKKGGRNVDGDLKRISEGYKFVFKGAIELGLFCSARKYIPSGRISLSEISSIILRARISKDERLCLTSDKSNMQPLRHRRD